VIRGVIDGPYLTYRTYCAGGESQEALYKNTVNVVLDMLELVDELWIAWEHIEPGKGLELRRNDYPDYKCRRTPKATDYYAAIQVVQDTIGPLGVHQVFPGMGEADDAAATLARQWTSHEVSSVASSIVLWVADKDWLQLLTLPGVSVIRPPAKGLGQGTRITAENMVDHVGVAPQWWTAFLALAGDTTDDVPGIAQIGAGRATKLLQCCPELVDLVLAGVGDQAVRTVAAADASMVKWAQRVADSREQLLTMMKLVTLRDVPLAIRRGNLDRESAPAVLEGLGCGWAVNRFLGLVGDDWGEDDAPVDDWSE
jgi:DNA polymerase-1